MLILALWALTLLTVFAVNLGVYVQGKTKLLERLEHRQELRLTAESGVYRAIAVAVEDFVTNPENDPVVRKRVRHNNPEAFRDVRRGRGRFSVSYPTYDDPRDSGVRRYGLSDEQGRINLNTADRGTLARLIELVLGKDSIDADKIAAGIVDWRQFGESDIVGFFSDEYYSRLDEPYEPKKSHFEILEELKMVKFITEEDYAKLRDFVTVYGDGRLNVNTASRTALLAAGMTSGLADKVLYVRKGPDGKEATNDDIIFNNPGEIVSFVSDISGLSDGEVKLINGLTASGALGTRSGLYRADVRAGYDFAPEEKTRVSCVFNAFNGNIIYWREL